jgi:phosphoribosylglycinamide formyltransferase-1
MRCAVFASGGGSNFQTLIDRQETGELHATLALLVGNNSSATAFDRARRHGIPTLHIAPSHFDSQQLYTERLLQELERHGIEIIALAGYMKMLPPELVERYRNRIVNIHPGLLPAFGGKGMYGKRVHEAVLAYGCKLTGVTVHFVDEEYDHGPVITQEPVPVLDEDTAETLAARVLRVEHAAFWRAVNALAQGSIRVEGRKVIGTVERYVSLPV